VGRGFATEIFAFSVSQARCSFFLLNMERMVKKSRGFLEAEAWDKQQYRSMSPVERMRAARALKNRLFPGKNPDVRECQTSQKVR
jgi:hypothetical protein